MIRLTFLVLVAGMLVSLGRYEERLRDEIRGMARWPSMTGALPACTTTVLPAATTSAKRAGASPSTGTRS